MYIPRISFAVFSNDSIDNATLLATLPILIDFIIFQPYFHMISSWPWFHSVSHFLSFFSVLYYLMDFIS